MATAADTPDVSLSKQHEKARTVVRALAARDGTADAATIKSVGGFDHARTVRYHADRLCAATPFVERTGRTIDVGAPKESVEYCLTTTGERAVADLADEDTGLPVEAEVEHLKTAVRSLRSDLETAQAEAERAHDRIDRINDFLHDR